MHSLLFAIEQAPNRASESARLAKLYFLHSELFTHQRNLNGTMMMLEKTWAIQPSTSIALQISGVLISAKLFKQAQIWLARAKRANSHRKLGAPSREGEINHLARQIRNTTAASP